MQSVNASKDTDWASFNADDLEKAIVELTLKRLDQGTWPAPVIVDLECVAEIRSTVTDAMETLSVSGGEQRAAARRRPVGNDRAVGAASAAALRHPAEGMVIAEVLFDTALEPFAAWANRAFSLESATVARLLHHVIWKRFPAGAVGYAAELRQRVFHVERDARLKVSRDLHDHVAHRIVVAGHHIELALATDLREPSVIQSLRDARRIIGEVLDDVRNIASRLRDHVGDRLLTDALEQYVRQIPQTGPMVTFTNEGEPRMLAPAIGEEIFLIAIEAIRNAQVHAVSTAVHVALAWNESTIALDVRDNGRGFDPAQMVAGSGVGLRSMQERALLIGATFSLTSSVEEGTRMHVSVPILSGGLT